MKYIRALLLVFFSLAIIGTAGWFFVGWSISQAFKPAVSEGGGLRKLASVLEASVGGTLARGDVLAGPEAGGGGALTYYQKNPQALQRDSKFFNTWYSALAIADAGNTGHQLGRWESSARADWITPSQRTDAWGHAFCIQSNKQLTIVVSPGPQALSSLDCNTLKISEEVIARMHPGRLNSHISGALILFVKRP